MRKEKIFEKFKKIIISIMCVITLIFAMPVKAKAGIFEDFVDLILKIPDGVMFIANWWLADRSPSGAIDTMALINLKGIHGGPWGIDDDGYIYNFHVTPYDIFTCGEVREYQDSAGNNHSFRNLPIFYANFFNLDDGINAENDSYALKSNEILRPVIGNIYIYLRNLCLVLMMLVLLYIGIRIIVSSVSSEQAKYKNMLADWLIGICLLFLMHYMMSFIMNINDVIVNMLQNDESASYYICFGRLGFSSVAANGWGEEWYEFFDDYDDKTFIDLHLDIPGNASDSENGKWQDTGFLWWHEDGAESSVSNTGFPFYETNATIQVDTHKDWGNDGLVKINAYINGESNNNYHICVYKANLTEYIRTISSYSQSLVTLYTNNHKGAKVASTSDSDLMAKMGYGILYITLVVETVMFSVVYFKRLLQLAFLTMIAPLVAFMYPIDKVGDGKAQAFNTWLKDYIFNVLIQPLHLLIYTIFITAAMDLFTKNIIYALAIYAFMIVAEKYFKKIFGFDKASTGGGGPLGNVLGAGMAMHGLNRLTGLGPPGPLGGGKKSLGGGSDSGKKPKISKLKPPKEPKGDGTNQLPGSLSERAKNLGKRVWHGTKENVRSKFNTGRSRIAKAATGEKYDRLIGRKGAFKAAAKHIGGSVAKQGGKLIAQGAGRGLSMATRGGIGLMAGAATAMATGDINNLAKGVGVGLASGWKNGGKIANSTIGVVGRFSDDAKAWRAENDEEYAKKLRRDDARVEFKDVSLNAKQYEALDELSPYIDFNGDVNKLDAAIEARNNGATLEEIKQAESDSNSWNDLKTKSDHESYLKFQTNQYMQNIQDSEIDKIIDQTQIEKQAKLEKEAKIAEAEKKREETANRYDKKIAAAKQRGNLERVKELEKKAYRDDQACKKELEAAQKAKYDKGTAEKNLREQIKKELAQQKAEEDYQRALAFQQKSKKTSK